MLRVDKWKAPYHAAYLVGWLYAKSGSNLNKQGSSIPSVTHKAAFKGGKGGYIDETVEYRIDPLNILEDCPYWPMQWWITLHPHTFKFGPAGMDGNNTEQETERYDEHDDKTTGPFILMLLVTTSIYFLLLVKSSLVELLLI